jgi:hypothetical protein
VSAVLVHRVGTADPRGQAGDPFGFAPRRDARSPTGPRRWHRPRRDFGLSWPVVHAAFLDHATAVLPAEPGPVVAPGIDETRRGKPRFARGAGTGVFERIVDRRHTGFVDLSGDQGLLGQVEGRSSGDAGSWPAARTQHWRDGVATVAIDMCSAYRAAVREHLPHATLVVDHFPVVQRANQVLRSVRRQRRQRGRQPTDQTGGPQRLRLPKPHQPTPTITLRKHPSDLATNQARLTSKTRIGGGHLECAPAGALCGKSPSLAREPSRRRPTGS